MFVAITMVDQVPRVGEGYETPLLDLKAHPDAYRGTINGKPFWRRFDLAKDVAAFANGSGGTILLGASEDRTTGTCSGHNPFDLQVATEFEVVLKDALEERCHPRPFVQVDRRRSAILLSSLKAGDKIRIHPKMLLPNDQFTTAFEVTFVRLEEIRNCFVVKFDGREVGAPLDDTSVWYEGDGCHIRCDRRLLVR